MSRCSAEFPFPVAPDSRLSRVSRPFASPATPTTKTQDEELTSARSMPRIPQSLCRSTCIIAGAGDAERPQPEEITGWSFLSGLLNATSTQSASTTPPSDVAGGAVAIVLPMTAPHDEHHSFSDTAIAWFTYLARNEEALRSTPLMLQERAGLERLDSMSAEHRNIENTR
ncbi:hypothetical protein BD779DRAFT_1680981 [Infundibulicybe gibba]|nr:hypothetical protein BD779DRAFT_1680981 [Infundibulicybe gibba]